jgi:ribonuclease P protein component
MLPIAHRLRKEQDIKTLFAKGRGVFGKPIGLKYMKNGLEQTRFAFVVGTKVSKKAVERNRLKRRAREIVHARIDQIVPGFDVMFLTQKGATDLRMPDLEKSIVDLLKRARLL